MPRNIPQTNQQADVPPPKAGRIFYGASETVENLIDQGGLALSPDPVGDVSTRNDSATRHADTGKRRGICSSDVPPGKLQPAREPSPYAYVPTKVEPRQPPTSFTYWGLPSDLYPSGEVVYFIYSAGRIKIGTTTDIEQRLLSFTAAGPVLPAILLIMRGTIREEREYHKQFATSRLHGEWFAWSKDIENFLARRLCPAGRSTLEKAQADFKAYCSDFIAGVATLPKVPKAKPYKLCPHGLRAHRKCAHCQRDVALSRLARLEEHLADPNRDPNKLDHEWISQPRRKKNAE